MQLPAEVTEDAVLVWSGGVAGGIEVTDPAGALRRTIDLANPLELAIYDSVEQLGLPMGPVESSPDWTEKLPLPRASFQLTQADGVWETTNGLPRGLANVTRPSARDRWCQWTANAPIPLGSTNLYSMAGDGKIALVDDGATVFEIRPGSSRSPPQLVDLGLRLPSRLLNGTSTALWTTEDNVLFRLVGSVADGLSAERETEIGSTIFHAAHIAETILMTDTNGGVWRKVGDEEPLLIGNTVVPGTVTVSGGDFFVSTATSVARVRDSVVQIYETASKVDPPIPYPQGGVLFGETVREKSPELIWLEPSGTARTLEVFPIQSARMLLAGLEDGFLLHANFSFNAATSARTYDGILCDPPQIERQEFAILPLSIFAVESSFVAIRQDPMSRELFLLGLYRE